MKLTEMTSQTFWESFQYQLFVSENFNLLDCQNHRTVCYERVFNLADIGTEIECQQLKIAYPTI